MEIKGPVRLWDHSVMEKRGLGVRDRLHGSFGKYSTKGIAFHPEE